MMQCLFMYLDIICCQCNEKKKNPPTRVALYLGLARDVASALHHIAHSVKLGFVFQSKLQADKKAAKQQTSLHLVGEKLSTSAVNMSRSTGNT